MDEKSQGTSSVFLPSFPSYVNNYPPYDHRKGLYSPFSVPRFVDVKKGCDTTLNIIIILFCLVIVFLTFLVQSDNNDLLLYREMDLFGFLKYLFNNS